MRAGIQNYLQSARPQRSPLASAMLQRSLGQRSNPTVRAGEIANAGLFGAPGTLPSDPGPVEPPILTQGGGNYPGVGPQRPDIWTRMDPNMGPINPSLTINPGAGGNNPVSAGPTGGISFGPGGQLRGGQNGPQGSVYGIDPNTGQPIYNVTGSPRPGFFDSKTGKFVAGVASAGLNMFVPGLGFVSKAVFDAIRAHQNAKNTGTDLSGNAPTGAPPPQSDPSGPAWFQPGYQLPAGIQGAIARGDYQTAYGASPSSIEAGKIMSSQAFGGSPNFTSTTGDAGHTIFGPGQFAGHAEGGVVTSRAKSTYGPGPAGLQPWVMPTQSEAWNQDLTHTDRGSVQRSNDWLMAHNQANNAILDAWRKRQQPLPPAPPLQIIPAGG